MKKNPIEEARRYVDNAKKALKDNGKLNTETHRYDDPKMSVPLVIIFGWVY